MVGVIANKLKSNEKCSNVNCNFTETFPFRMFCEKLIKKK